MTKPTYQDATLLVQMAQWATAAGLNQANSWLYSDAYIPEFSEFIQKYPPGSDEFNKVTVVLMFMETLGTLYKNGLFNEKLLFDWLAVNLTWEKTKGFALGMREQMGSPRLYENFEAMAKVDK